jgi:hypothetical protein
LHSKLLRAAPIRPFFCPFFRQYYSKATNASTPERRVIHSRNCSASCPCKTTCLSSYIKILIVSGQSRQSSNSPGNIATVPARTPLLCRAHTDEREADAAEQRRRFMKHQGWAFNHASHFITDADSPSQRRVGNQITRACTCTTVAITRSTRVEVSRLSLQGASEVKMAW